MPMRLHRGVIGQGNHPSPALKTGEEWPALVKMRCQFWNPEAPDLSTQTVRAWIQDVALPPTLLPV